MILKGMYIDMRHLNSEKVRENIERRMAEDQADGRVGGAGICVMQDGRVIYKNYFGKKSYQTGEDMADGDRVIFRLASMTKPITTAAVLIQVGRGLVDLDTPVCHWLPDYAEMDVGRLADGNRVERIGKAQHKLTLRILLNHTNGLGSDTIGQLEQGRMTPADMVDLKHVVDFMSGMALAFDPTTAQAYSPTAGFDVAARVVELTSGMHFDQFLKQNIFDPCGMADTTFAPTKEQFDRMIRMHNRTDDGRSEDSPTCPGCVFEDYPVTRLSGGAGLAATLPDYVRFAEMLVNGGRAGDVQVIPVGLVKAMGTPTVPDSVMPGPQKWGLGVRVIDSDTYQIPRHCFGWSGAYGTHFWVDPDNRITAVYMKNSRYDGGSGARTAYLFEQDVYQGMED